VLGRNMPTEAIESWLREEREDRLELLWQTADSVRCEHVGDAVHLRGLIEISNVCVRSCAYCGLRAANRSIERYRLTEAQIMDCVARAVEFGYGTVVMQAGEDPGIECEWLCGIIRRIKAETPLAVTLSLGERPMEELRAWREAGADRYLLRFETSDRALYDAVHPPLPGRASDRIAMLREIRALGYEAGSGVLIGLPGQTYRSLAQDVALFRELDLDMIGVGPYIPHPDTPLGQQVAQGSSDGREVPPTELMAYKMVALTRIVRPDANIPSTTALATINQVQGRELGLQRGANVVMPNLTPVEYRGRYEIYPGKACVSETAEECRLCLRGRIESIGRTVGVGQGGRAKRGS